MILSYLAGNSLVTIEFDATLREDPTSASDITDYHVETGSDRTDNARPQLDRATFDVVVTNTPIRNPGTNTDGATGSFGPVPIQTPTILQIPRILPGIGLITDLLPHVVTTNMFDVLSFDSEMNRVKSVYNELLILQKGSVLVNLSTYLREYTGMIIQRLSAPRGPADGSSLTFSFDVKEMHFVDSEIVAVKADSPLSAKDKGPKAGVKPDAPLTSMSKAMGTAAGVTSATVRTARVPL